MAEDRSEACRFSVCPVLAVANTRLPSLIDSSTTYLAILDSAFATTTTIVRRVVIESSSCKDHGCLGQFFFIKQRLGTFSWLESDIHAMRPQMQIDVAHHPGIAGSSRLTPPSRSHSSETHHFHRPQKQRLQLGQLFSNYMLANSISPHTSRRSHDVDAIKDLNPHASLHQTDQSFCTQAKFYYADLIEDQARATGRSSSRCQSMIHLSCIVHAGKN